MKTVIAVIFVTLGGVFTSRAQYNKDNLNLDKPLQDKEYKLDALQLYPIRANEAFFNAHKGLGKYISLQTALEGKKISITEHMTKDNNGGEVNTLYVENTSNEVILILAGEVVKGGKQDRMIAQDFILAPGSGKKDVSVFCVEHGRWQAERDNGGNSFTSYFSISSNEVRKAGLVKKDQQTVWDKVSETTAKNSADTQTGSLTALKNSDDLNQKLNKYTTYFLSSLSAEENVIGIIAVSGNSVLGCDMFANHELFKQHLPNLIQSYATEAVSSGGKVTLSPQKVSEYFFKLVSDEQKQEKEIEKNGTILRDGNRKVHLSAF